jgi:COMPASS component SWD3
MVPLNCGMSTKTLLKTLNCHHSPLLWVIHEASTMWRRRLRAPCIATASDDKTLRLWDAHTAEALVEFRGHSSFVFCVKFNPQSNLLVSGSFDETVKLWDVRTGDCVSTLPAHSDPVTGVDLNRDGTCIVSGSHDGLLRIWDTATGECLKTIYAQANPPVSMVKYSPNGKYILSGTLDGKLRLWKTSSCCKTYSSHVNTKYCLASDFLVSNPHRQSIVTGSETGQIYIYDLNSQKPRRILEGHSDVVLAVTCH